MILLLFHISYRLLNNNNIVTGLKDVSLCGQQSHTFPSDRCTYLDLHFIGLDPDLIVFSLVPGY